MWPGPFVAWLRHEKRVEVGADVELLDRDGAGARMVTVRSQMGGEIAARVPLDLFTSLRNEQPSFIEALRVDVECPNESD